MTGTGVWWYITGAGFLTGIVFLLMSAVIGYLMLNQLVPLLLETKQSVQDIGDLTAHTVGSVADTLELAELRITQVTAQASHGGVSTSRQSTGIGMALALLLITSRLVPLFRKSKSKKRKR